MRVKDAMNQEFETCFTHTPLIEVIHIFAKYKINIIPIVDQKSNLIGLITKNRVIQAISNGHAISEAIRPLVNFEPITIHVEHTTYETQRILLKNQIGHAPVTDENNHVVGLISTRQILSVYKQVVDMLQSQLQLLFDSLQFGLLSVDRQMNVITANPLAKKILDIPDNLKNAHGKLQQNKKIVNMIHHVLKNKEGSVQQKVSLEDSSFLVDCSPLFEENELTGVMIIMDDLTKLEQLAMELETSKQWEEKLRTVIESAYDAILLVDEKGKITIANKGFYELFETIDRDVINTSITSNFPELGINDVLKTKKPLTGMSKNINSKQCLVTNLPIKNNGQLVGVVSKITYKGLEQLHDALNKVSKLEKSKPLTSTTEQSFDTRYLISDIIGVSHAIKEVKKEAYAATRSKSTVLLIGESGTGKEVFAQGIHAISPQPGSFVKVNCSAIPKDLMESEFFGYAEGAFTGAKKGGRKGKFELAQNGTLFLDEIGDLPLELQPKLLRVLQENEFEPIGSNQTIKLNVRIIAATNKNLEQMVREGKFREDLYYRLNVLQINIPPLRDRKEDIPDIVDFIIDRLNHSGFFIRGVTSNALKALIGYSWPGNIRELENVLERAANLNENGYIDVTELPDYILEHQSNNTEYIISSPETKGKETMLNEINLKESIQAKEKNLIIKALENANGNKTEASKILGISRTWLYKKMHDYNIDK